MRRYGQSSPLAQYACTRYDVRMKRAALKRGGARLRRWLQEKARTQEWLAEQIGTHQTNVSAWILGRPISIEMAVAIRKVTRIPVEDWVEPAANEADAERSEAKAS